MYSQGRLTTNFLTVRPKSKLTLQLISNQCCSLFYAFGWLFGTTITETRTLDYDEFVALKTN